ncbi:MAG TPA: hypothetical protein VJR87_11125 [Allosphingosinicella sp.]|nr:hypothetical protein [Allosphingosinicella sp.]
MKQAFAMMLHLRRRQPLEAGIAAAERIVLIACDAHDLVRGIDGQLRPAMREANPAKRESFPQRRITLREIIHVFLSLWHSVGLITTPVVDFLSTSSSDHIAGHPGGVQRRG